MKYFVYILRSLKNNFIYVGSSQDVGMRLKLHNSRKVKSTRAYVPWQLLEVREFDSRSDAVKMEKFLKTGQQKEFLRKRFLK